ncbi:MAG: hypothetical protein AAGG46_04850, partial [Planctomycetota bacterium]
MGVSFAWEPLDDAGGAVEGGEPSGVEYTVVVEPSLIAALGSGQTRVIESDVPPEAGPVRRVRVVLGDAGGVKHRVARPVTGSQTLREETAQSVAKQTGVVLPHLRAHTARQPISGGQLESGFAQANTEINQFGQSVTQFGQTVQQGSSDAQQAFAATQQQFNNATATVDSQRTIGGEVRNGAGRLFDRAGNVLGRTGEAIGGTARNVRDGVRNILPGRRQQPSAAASAAGSDFQAFSYQTAPAAATTQASGQPLPTQPLPTQPLPGQPLGGQPITAPMNASPVIASPPSSIGGPTPIGSATNFNSGGIATQPIPPSTDPSVTIAPPAPREQSVVVGPQPRGDLTPVAPFVLPTSGAQSPPASEPFFDSNNRFGRNAGAASPPANQFGSG